MDGALTEIATWQLNEYFPRFRNFSSTRLAFFGAFLNCISIAPLRTICSVFRCANIAQEPEPEPEAEPAPAPAPALKLDLHLQLLMLPQGIISRRSSKGNSCRLSPVHNKMPACVHDGRMWLTWPTCNMQRSGCPVVPPSLCPSVLQSGRRKINSSRRRRPGRQQAMANGQ